VFKKLIPVKSDEKITTSNLTSNYIYNNIFNTNRDLIGNIIKGFTSKEYKEVNYYY